MFGIGGFELFIILVFGFLIFGPEKLPDIAKTVGRGIARFREAQEEMNDTIGGEKIFDPNNPDEPFKDPVEVLDRIAQRQEEKKASEAKQGAGAKDAASSKPAPEPAGKPAAGNAEATPGAAGAETESGSQAVAPARQESFTERKARYERERAARMAAGAEPSPKQAGAVPVTAEPAPGTDAPVADVPAEGGDA